MKHAISRSLRFFRSALWNRTALLLGLVFVVVTVGAGLFISRVAVDPIASREAEELLGRIANESTAVTDRYLGSAQSVVEFAVEAVPALPDDDALLSEVFAAAVGGNENLTALYIGYPNGEFTFVARAEETTGATWRTRIIRLNDDGTRQLEQRWVDSDFNNVQETAAGPADYNPTERPWYGAFLSLDATTAWSDPYVFFSSGEIGLTYSEPVRADDGTLLAVVGADLRLTELITFLRDRRPTPTSRVQVVDGSGRVLAAASMDAQNPSARPVTIPDSSDVIAATTTLGLNPAWSLVVGAETSELLSSTDDFRTSRALLTGLLVAMALAALVGVLGALSYVRALRQAAAVDTLTRLESRWGVTRSIPRFLRRGSGLATLAIIDLDGFKDVNDQLGHAAGDRALRCVGDRLCSAVPGQGIVGRLGGDEFVVVLSDNDDPDAVLSAIQDRLSEPMRLGELEVPLGASIGTTTTARGRPADVSRLLREADLALYEVKAAGGGASVGFEPDMERRKLDELDRRRRLEAAIANGEFCLHFQPEVDLATTTIVGAEALLRWNIDGDRVIAADEFIDDLERFGLVDRVFDVVALDAVELAEQLDDSLTLRVNIAAGQIIDASVLTLVETFTERLPGVRLCLELTERSVLDATPHTRAALDVIRTHGVRIALDDFGTGFGSLKQLHDLPIDVIKIDRSFVAHLDADEPDSAITSILVELGSQLGVAVVAEGIETHQQYNALRALGCATGQGWLFAPALPAAEFLELVARGHLAQEIDLRGRPPAPTVEPLAPAAN